MPDNRNASPAPAGSERPLWARATSAFAAPSFDVRSKRDFADAMREYVTLTPGEQAYHQAHLLFRGVQALEGVHTLLTRLDRRLSEMDLDGLRHLGPMRTALEDLADGQEDLLESLAGGRSPEDDTLLDEEAPDLSPESERPIDAPDRGEILDLPEAA